MDWATLAIFAGALVLNAGSPGPSVAALVARVLTAGPASVLPFLAAMWLGEAMWLTAAVWGLSALAAAAQGLFAALKWAGIAYLLWLAWKMWHAPVGEGAAMPARGGWALFGSGMALTLGNPKIMAFYLALLPALVDLARLSAAGWLELVGVMLAVLVAVDLSWVAAAGAARGFLRSSRARRITNRASAVAMGGAAAAIAAR